MLRHVWIAAVLVFLPLLSVAAEPADPYLWLEEVEGEKALAWVKEQNRRTVDRARGGPGVQADLRAHARDPRLQGADPVRRSCRAATGLQLLAGRRARARHLAAHHARVVPHGEPGVGDGARHRRAGEGRGRALGLQGRDCLAPELPPLHGQPVARRRATPPWSASSTPSPRRSSTGGFALPEAKSDVAWKDADTLWVGTDFGAGLADHLGLPAHRQGVAARHAAVRGDDRLRGPAPDDVGVWLRTVETPEGRYDLVTPLPTILPARRLPRRRRPPGQARHPGGRRAPGHLPATGCCSRCAPTGRSADRPTARARCWPSTSTTCCRASRDVRRSLFEPTERVSLASVATTRDRVLADHARQRARAAVPAGASATAAGAARRSAARPRRRRHRRPRATTRRLLLPTRTS